MKRILPIIITILFSFISCATTTGDYGSSVALDQSMPIGDKLEYFGARNVSVDLPRCYFDGTDWLEDMTRLVSNAKDYILISTFLGSSSPNLENFYRTLISKAEEGVKIYFIIDGTSSYDMTESQYYMTPLYFLRKHGINLLEYAPLSGMRIINPMALVIRDHRKLLVIDGEIAAIGGMNINYISLGAGEGKTQRDSMYVFHSKTLSKAFVEEFIAIWNASSIDKMRVEDFPLYDDESLEYDAWLFNRGTGSNDSISGMYGSLIGSARKSILLFPYLPILNDDMSSALKRATDRGVDVNIVMPVDLRGYAKGGMYYYFPKLLESTGANIRVSVEDEEGNALPLLHEKMMVVDERYVVIGSANFNFRSMELSHELALVIDSPEFASMLIEHSNDIVKGSYVLTPEIAKELKKEDSNFLSYLFMYFGG